MIKINYLKGDATNPQGQGNKIIVHVCNDKNAWGAGFVLAVSKKWPQPQEAFHKEKYKIYLGDIQIIKVEDDIYVINMIAQFGFRKKPTDPTVLSYGALKVCLAQVNMFARDINASVHMPRIGTGLAGGDWNQIEKIIQDCLVVPTYVYDLQ